MADWLAEGALRAAGCAKIEHHDAGSDKLAYYRARTGTAPVLVVRSGHPAALAALGALLARLETDWTTAGAIGANLLWPSRDIDVSATFNLRGLRPDAYLAYQSAAELRHTGGGTVDDSARTIRTAVPADEPILLRLQEEVLLAHIPHSPFARRVPGVTVRFRERLAASWAGQSPLDGGCLVTVVEESGEVVGMSECFLTRQRPALDMVLPEGLHGYVNTFGVLPHCRGSGLGRLLADAVAARLLTFGVRGIQLYFSHYNRGAAAFWPRLGYAPLWHTYQRHDLVPTAGTDPPWQPAAR